MVEPGVNGKIVKPSRGQPCYVARGVDILRYMLTIPQVEGFVNLIEDVGGTDWQETMEAIKRKGRKKK